MKQKWLIIEDDEIAQFLTEMELQNVPTIEAQFLHSAEEALSKLQAMDPQDFFEVILVDINLSGMCGFNFIKYYQDKNFTRKFPQTKLITASTSTLNHELETSQQNPLITAHFMKPLSRETFELILELKKDRTNDDVTSGSAT